MKICPKCAFKFENYASYCNFCDLSLEKVKSCSLSEITDNKKSNLSTLSRPEALRKSGEIFMVFPVATLVPLYVSSSSVDQIFFGLIFWLMAFFFGIGFILFVAGVLISIINKEK